MAQVKLFGYTDKISVKPGTPSNFTSTPMAPTLPRPIWCV